MVNSMASTISAVNGSLRQIFRSTSILLRAVTRTSSCSRVERALWATERVDLNSRALFRQSGAQLTVWVCRLCFARRCSVKSGRRLSLHFLWMECSRSVEILLPRHLSRVTTAIRPSMTYTSYLEAIPTYVTRAVGHTMRECRLPLVAMAYTL